MNQFGDKVSKQPSNNCSSNEKLKDHSKKSTNRDSQFPNPKNKDLAKVFPPTLTKSSTCLFKKKKKLLNDVSPSIDGQSQNMMQQVQSE